MKKMAIFDLREIRIPADATAAIGCNTAIEN